MDTLGITPADNKDINIEEIKQIIDSNVVKWYKTKDSQERAADFALAQYVSLTKLGYTKIVSEADLVFKCLNIISQNCDEIFKDEDIKVKSKKASLVIKRHVFCYLANFFLNTKKTNSEFSKTVLTITKRSTQYKSAVARYIGMQHGTVINSLKVLPELMCTDRKLKGNVVMLQITIEPQLYAMLNSFGYTTKKRKT